MTRYCEFLRNDSAYDVVLGLAENTSPARRRDWRDPSQYGVGVRSLQAELSRLEKLQAVSEAYMVKCDEVLRLQ